MIIGTSHFNSYKDAIRYYKEYHYADTEKAVISKLKEGAIHIGAPRLKNGESLKLNEEGRFLIIEK